MPPLLDDFTISCVGQLIRCALIVFAITCRRNYRGTAASFIRSGGSWGNRMDQEFKEEHSVTNESLFHVSNLAARKAISTRCELPLGRAIICGDARHREDRAPDSELVSGGARSHDVWLIRSGILRLQRYAYDGRRQILSLFFPGEIVGFDREFREGVTVETATQSGLCRIDRRWFDGMVNKNESLRAEIFRQKQDQLDRLHWLTWSLGTLRPEERLSAFLALSTKVMPYQPQPDGTGVLSLQLPRRDIADLLGTTVESICRIVHKLANTGFIEIRDPAHFRVLDLPGLIALGKIRGHFGKMCGNLAIRSGQLEGLLEGWSENSVCFCGRGLGALTAINDPQARHDNLSHNRNFPSGGFGK